LQTCSDAHNALREHAVSKSARCGVFDLLNLEQGLKRIVRQPLNYATTWKREVEYCTVYISEYVGSRERLNLC
jgi:hypothetical protein